MKQTSTIGLLFFALLICSFSSIHAQQQYQYSQFMHFPMGVNPAAAGSEKGIVLGALVRNQWLGLDGAPQTQLITFNMPLSNERIGIGANLSRATIGITSRITTDLIYSYRIRVGSGHLGLGVQASIQQFRNDYTDLVATQERDLDPSIPTGTASKFLPNFGAGLFYNTKKFYAGFGIPRLLQNNIDLADADGFLSREAVHMYIALGGTIEINDNLKLQPNGLFKYVNGAPFDGDINFNLLIIEKFTTGLSYRLGGSGDLGFGESVSLLAGALIQEKFFIGAAYDYPLSEIRDYSSGTIEVFLRYNFQGNSSTTDSKKNDPRKPKSTDFF